MTATADQSSGIRLAHQICSIFFPIQDGARPYDIMADIQYYGFTVRSCLGMIACCGKTGIMYGNRVTSIEKYKSSKGSIS
jgi:hypothetical protein